MWNSWRLVLNDENVLFNSKIFHRSLKIIIYLNNIDLKLQLSATDYGNFLANEPSPIATATIHEKATQKLVDEFKYVRANAVEPLATFLDYLT